MQPRHCGPATQKNDKPTDEEYAEFYKSTFKQYDEPMAKSHFSLEGQVEFKALLYVPGTVPWELSQDMFNEKVRPMKLYVNKVFISDKFSEDLLPRWLNFLKGIVDSDDLPLNVSRELLQRSKVLQIIRKRVVRKALDMLEDLKKDENKFKQLTENFGRYIKIGLIKDRILDIASFDTSASDKPTTMADYVSRMKEGQKVIYFIPGASRAAASSSPVLERLKKQNFEVLFAIGQIDEYALTNVGNYMEYDIVDASKED